MKFTGFEGETNEVCHAVRDGRRVSKGKVIDNFDVVIIGGGISGLTGAYKLKDKLNVKLIEKEKSIGGASRRGLWNGIHYSYGTADTAPGYEVTLNGRKVNYLDSFYKELAIPWKKIEPPFDALFFGENLLIDPFEHPELVKSMFGSTSLGFEEALSRINKFEEKYGKPTIPFETCSPQWAEMDRKNLRDIFADLDDYFLRFLETYSKSTFGAPASEISAFEGLYYLSREMETRIACPGGNACVSEALANHLEGKIETSATVTAILPEKDSYFVTYINEQGQEMTLESRAIIWACQKHYAPYVIKGLPKDRAEAFRKVRYDAYLVANIFVNNPFYDVAFTTYFEDTIFTDMVIADWMVTGGKKKTNSLEPEVYTLYCPLGEQNRYTLLSTPDEEWISQILQGLKKHFSGAEKSIVDIKLFEYGHHYVLGYPGFTSGTRVAAKKPFGNIYFAKDDMQGIPCLEGAVWSGIESAESVLQKIG